MNEDRDTIAAMRAVTISREYGSGGGEIAAHLAQGLQWQLIDHEVVVRVAEKLQVSEEEAEDQDECVESLSARIFKSLRLLHPTMPVTVDIPQSMDSRAFREAAPSMQRQIKRKEQGDIGEQVQEAEVVLQRKV